MILLENLRLEVPPPPKKKLQGFKSGECGGHGTASYKEIDPGTYPAKFRSDNVLLYGP